MKIKYSALMAALILSTLFFSCKTKSKRTSQMGVKGRYINSAFLKYIPDSIPGNIFVYCYELNFNKADSANVFYGFEQGKVAYKKQDDKYKLINASQGKDLAFIINKDSSITLIDSTVTGSHTNSLFVKVDNIPGKEWVFEKYLNDKMITGEYVLYKNGIATPQKVQFTSDGQVKGLKPYTNFSICYSGDCVEETEPISNLIALKGNDSLANLYAFKINKTANSIIFYNIEAPIKDIKGNRQILDKAYEFRKK